MRLDDLRRSRVALLGLSVEGLSTAKYLAKKHVLFSILEKKELGELVPQAQEFVLKGGYELISGQDHLKKLSDFDIIFRSPGVPLWFPEIDVARRSGVTFTSHTQFFFDICPSPIIGVTGTKGKGTAAALIFEMLKGSGRDVYLGGNIGRPPLDLVDDLKPSSWVVLELSSFQLEDIQRSPHIAVVLMVTQEHLNSQSQDSPNFHRSIDGYKEAKRNIVRFQEAEDYAVINSDYINSFSLAQGLNSRVFYFSTQKELEEGSFIKDGNFVARIGKAYLNLGMTSDPLIRGSHNWQNILAASTAALLAGARASEISRVIKSFKGLEHRLEFVREVGGVKYYNDSFSTTPETATAAVRSFTEPLIVILGGSDKGSDYSLLGQVIVESKNIKAVILIGNTAEKIEAAIDHAQQRMSNLKLGFNPVMIRGLKDMDEVVEQCASLGFRGDVVLLSPACASFDMFKDYKDRGQQFKGYVNKL